MSKKSKTCILRDWSKFWWNCPYIYIRTYIYIFTTCLPAVTDVFESGRNVGALRPGHPVGFRSLVAGLADDISRGYIFFVTPPALKLLKIGPNSKRGK